MMKHTEKRLLSVLLSLTLLCSMVLPAAAAENISSDPEEAAIEESAGTLEPVTVVNPLYEGIVQESDLLDPASVPAVLAASDESDSMEEAVETLRQGMVDRRTSIQITLTSENSSYTSLMRQLMQEAAAHTGVSTEGDYLLWQYAGYSVGGTYRLNGGVYTYTFTYTITYYTDAEEEKEVTAKLSEIMPQIITDGMTDYEKICAIYHYICCNVTYDYEHLSDSSYKHQFTAYGALIKGTSVCQGYAVLFYRMALEAGLDARVITGTEYASNDAHAWNIVCLDGSYYNLDATWDSSIYTSRGEYYYFLETTASFNEHSRGADYVGTFYDAYPDPEENYSGEYIYHVMVFVHTTATCLEDGVDVFCCTVCGDTEEQPAIAAGAHELDAGEMTLAPTCTEEGEMSYICQVCGETVTEAIPAAGHDMVFDHVVTEATCGEDGLEVDYCAVCGEYELEVIPAPGHSWDEGRVNKSATCTEDGEMSYICQVCGATVTEVIPAAGHDMVLDHVVTEATCGEDGLEVDYCAVCSEYELEVIPATGEHSWDGGTVKESPTCLNSGETEYTCTVCGRSMTEITPATGEHSWDDGEVAAEASCAAGLMRYTCKTCGETKEETIPAVLAEHDWGEGEIALEPTCTRSGEMRYICQVCGTHKLEEIAPLGHTFVTDTAVAATCTEPGLTEGSHCAVCGTVFTAQETVAAVGHKPVTDPAVAATCTTDGKTAGTHCSVCGEVLFAQETIPAAGHTLVYVPTVEAAEEKDGNIAYYVCSVCGALFLDAEGKQETTLEDVTTKLLCAIDVFDDITDTDAWYYEAVDYVYHARIMTGTSDTTFSPDDTFSRAQMVTVLYRLAGVQDVPEVENPFADVTEDDWFYDEVMWAYSAGVTEGTSETTFSPNDPVTREQAITFLYRFTDKFTEHDISAEPVSDLEGYEDAEDVSDWAFAAVQWSVGNGIVQGTSQTTLEPGSTADRATAAQMLYNYRDGYLG